MKKNILLITFVSLTSFHSFLVVGCSSKDQTVQVEDTDETKEKAKKYWESTNK